MAIKPSQVCSGQFTVSSPSNGELTNADSTPTGNLVENGVVDAAVLVSISNIATGIYKWQLTVPADYTSGTVLQVRINATLNSVSVAGIVWSNTVDKQHNSDLAGSSFSSSYALDQQLSLSQVGSGVAEEVRDMTLSELAVLPPASPTLRQALMWLYQIARNKLVDDDNTELQEVYDNGGNAIAQASRTSSGGIFTREKFEDTTGPSSSPSSSPSASPSSSSST